MKVSFFASFIIVLGVLLLHVAGICLFYYLSLLVGMTVLVH
jgi:hypothetical protein